jgi:hypothetical protein
MSARINDRLNELCCCASCSLTGMRILRVHPTTRKAQRDLCWTYFTQLRPESTVWRLLADRYNRRAKLLRYFPHAMEYCAAWCWYYRTCGAGLLFVFVAQRHNKGNAICSSFGRSPVVMNGTANKTLVRKGSISFGKADRFRVAFVQKLPITYESAIGLHCRPLFLTRAQAPAALFQQVPRGDEQGSPSSLVEGDPDAAKTTLDQTTNVWKTNNRTNASSMRHCPNRTA